MVLAHEVLCSRKGAKDAKNFQNIPFAFFAAWREIYITQKISARKKSRKGAKGAKIHSEYLLARLAAWREIYITKKISAGKNSRKGAKDAKIFQNISLRTWRLGEKYISRKNICEKELSQRREGR